MGDNSFLAFEMIQRSEKGHSDILKFLRNLNIWSVRRPCENKCKALCLISDILDGFPKVIKII